VRTYLLVNPSSGRADVERLRDAGPHVLRPGEDAAERARAADADVLAVAGGDGTAGAVAQVAIERDLPLAVLPFGTYNHFARDLGLDPGDPLAALRDGRERRVDVARVNGRIFLNNLSLGVYARLVHRRDHPLADRVRAAAQAWRAPLRLTIDGAPVTGRIVLVANNAYRLDVLSIGERERLDEGRLYLYVAHGVLRTTWDERPADRLTIEAPTRRVRAAIDGEAVALDSPLEVAIEPRALRVLVPAGPE
jgi:diacylglycerol kinase family enzyme